jgi:hypothetical protein
MIARVQTPLTECLLAPINGRLVGRGIFIEQNSYHNRVGTVLPLRNCLSVSIQGALNSRVPQQFLLHLDVSARASQHRRVRMSKRMPINLSDPTP